MLKIIYGTNSGYIFKQDRINIYLKSKTASGLSYVSQYSNMWFIMFLQMFFTTLLLKNRWGNSHLWLCLNYSVIIQQDTRRKDKRQERAGGLGTFSPSSAGRDPIFTARIWPLFELNVLIGWPLKIHCKLAFCSFTSMKTYMHIPA